MDYSFYYKGSLSHCGVNNFTFAYIGDQWKIISLADSRRLSNCTFQNEKIAIENLLDDWHLAATNADSDTYFNLMTTNSIFIGTDKTEVWTKDEFMAFAAPYFEKGKAWDFKRVSRNVYSDDFEKTAWFDELLDTWMGPCRGSGVLVKENGEWRIQHYVLSVTVPNEEIESFLKIYDK
ncbi:MAG: nuclear transport factor 2 family protein [Saprospiraceae bacterium]|nr:nuclear transport factor 2 family protein [Bacteroidia bacterium]NNL92290.1 nuclear transport factor 2 family protein [Saprospiraceae bacterium]